MAKRAKHDRSKENHANRASPRVGVAAGGLVTVAYMKARLDEGKDQLGIFMPLVLDVLPTLPGKYFVPPDVQEALQSIHGVGMPLQAVTTLLRRASRQAYVFREEGSYRLNPDKQVPRSRVSHEKETLRNAQRRLGEALLQHAEKRSISIGSVEAALDLMLSFLEEQQVALLLGSSAEARRAATTPTPRESVMVAEFLHNAIANDASLKSTLSDILEGLVLYHAAFLPDLADADRHFKQLTVVFDSGFVRQVLGYEGDGPKLLGRETIDLLQSSGVRCVVFDKTVQEIHRILRVYEERLGTQQGRLSLRAYAMARHFILQRYSPSDVQEMSALLESEIAACGLRIVETPARLPQFTHGEVRLAERLADRVTQDADTPRVVHDVDCVAGILSLRRNHRSARIEDARAVFATTATLLIGNTTLWWDVDEGESGVPPVVHVRSLANLAWLKKPGVSTELQIRELVPLCAAAMRPSPKTWERFLVHLGKLESQNRLSADQVSAIMVSAVSDRLLRDAELDGDDVDASTLDEVVDRVMEKYRCEAEANAAEEIARHQRLIADAQSVASAQIVQAQHAAAERVTQAEEKFGNIAEELRRRDLALDGRSRRWTKLAVTTVYWLVVPFVVAGAVTLLLGHPSSSGWIGRILALAIGVFVLLEVFGVLSHLNHLRDLSEAYVHRRLRAWLVGAISERPNRVAPQIDGSSAG